MTRWKIIVEYDGGPFVGWQRQENGPSVQAALERASEGFAGEAVTVHGAGRTDSGVHALGQVAHFDLEKATDGDRVRDALNHHLKPNPIAILAAAAVDEEFHARFSATERHYLYRILDRRAPPALYAGRVWHVPRGLDAGAMHAAATLTSTRCRCSTITPFIAPELPSACCVSSRRTCADSTPSSAASTSSRTTCSPTRATSSGRR